MQQLVQYLDSDGARRVGLLRDTDASDAIQLSSTDSVYALMHRGLHERRALADLVQEFCTDTVVSIADSMNDERLMPAFDHPVSAARSFAWLDGTQPAPLEAPSTPQATAPVSGLEPNAQVYTVDVHLHLRLVGYMNVTHVDTIVLDGVLRVATDGDDTSTGSAAFETCLRNVNELRFGDVHFRIQAA